jgi:UDP-3-O-[3-hydroxymyristoyl] glucosamine N-acyltransferase
MHASALPAALATLFLLAAPASTRAGSDCHLEVGPRDRVAKGETLVIRAGERVDNAIAFQGDLVVEGDAVVQKAVAIGGTVTLRPGAQVKEDAVAIGGDVRLEGDARVGNDAVSLGGQVRQSGGSRVRGNVVGLAFQAGGSSLARQILKGVSAEDCQIVTKGETGG